MGKIRKEKKYRMHAKAPTARLGSEVEARPPLSSEGVAPLPEDIMKCKAVVNLLAKKNPGEGDSGLRRKKKERMKMKREQWLQKIELSKKQKREEREAEERQKTVVVGDMQPLAASLPTILSSDTPKEMKPSKQQSRSLLKEISHYQDVLKHPAFKQDPMATILEHAQNSVAKGTV